MAIQGSNTKNKTSNNRLIYVKNSLTILLILLLFLISIDLLIKSSASLSFDLVKNILSITSDPFIGLFIGLLITAMIQSSSTSTSLVVAFVASGALSLEDAIPIALGANIGTTITSSIVALGYIAKKNEFRKAITAATLHDFFNIFLVIILLPLELHYGLLSWLSLSISEFFTNGNDLSNSNPIIIGELISKNFYDKYLLTTQNRSILVLIVSFFMLFGSLKLFSGFIYNQLVSKTKERFQQVVFKKDLTSFNWGFFSTALLQSSSVTTSLIVPLVATGKITAKRAFPFIMGANIGTTITAFIAALYKSNAALSLAITHLLFNLFGVILFMPFEKIRNIPLWTATEFGKLTLKSRIIGFLYFLITFFLLPFTLIYIHQM